MSKYFNADLSDLAPPGGQYTHRVIDLAVRLVVEDGLPYRPARWPLARSPRLVPFVTIQNGRGSGKKRRRRAWIQTSLTGPLTHFWYVAADELYDGPFCILSAVDNRCYKRILYDVLDHDPTHEDIRAFLGRLKTALSARDLTLLGVTTDGSALYRALGGVPGCAASNCEFHIVAEVAKAVLGAVASARKALAAKQPKLCKGRPSTPAAKQAARTKKRLAAQSAAFVRLTTSVRPVSPQQNRTEDPVARQPWATPVPALRAIMEQVYAVFDRCRTGSLFAKLAKLRRRVQRFTSLGDNAEETLCPHLGQSPDVSHDKLLPQCRTRWSGVTALSQEAKTGLPGTHAGADQCTLALDMWREAQAEGRQQTLASLHRARLG